MVATMLYSSKRRAPSKEKREPRVIAHLRSLLEQLQDMSPDERQEAAANQWLPSEDCLKALLDPTLRQAERVERVIVYYKFDNGGASPSWDTVGGVLGISREAARQYGVDLVRQECADKVRGQLVLRHGKYLHFFVRRKTGA